MADFIWILFSYVLECFGTANNGGRLASSYLRWISGGVTSRFFLMLMKEVAYECI